MKFHVNNEGNVNPCFATVKPCQFSDSAHFDNEEDARKFYEASNETVSSISVKPSSSLSAYVEEVEVQPQKWGSYYGSEIDESVISRHLDSWRNHVGHEEAKLMEEAKAVRDGENRYHMTVITPQEVKKVGKKLAESAFKDISVGVRLGGIGTASDGDKEAWFVVAKCPEADRIREDLGLPAKDFHVTIGFKKSDVFSVFKDENTIVLS